jgi:hypothetical protein
MDSGLYEIAFLWMDDRYGGWEFGLGVLLNIAIKKNAITFYDIAFIVLKKNAIYFPDIGFSIKKNAIVF